MTKDKGNGGNSGRVSLSELRREAKGMTTPPVAVALPVTQSKPPVKVLHKLGLSFWLHLYLGSLMCIGLVVHGLIKSGYFASANILPNVWTVFLCVMVIGGYFIRRALTIEGSIIPRRATRMVWLTGFTMAVFWALIMYFTVGWRNLPPYFVDVTVPVLFLLFLMTKTLERARVSESVPILLSLGCIAAIFTTMVTLGYSNQYFIAASWVGLLVVVPKLRHLSQWI